MSDLWPDWNKNGNKPAEDEEAPPPEPQMICPGPGGSYGRGQRRKKPADVQVDGRNAHCGQGGPKPECIRRGAGRRAAGSTSEGRRY